MTQSIFSNGVKTRSLATSAINSDESIKTVLVAGGSYAGHEAVRILTEILPTTHKIVLLERNSHFNHVYAFPRYSVVDGHAHKAFIPYSNVFNESISQTRHQFIQGTLLNIENDQNGLATYIQKDGQQNTLEFDYCIYALGSFRPGSIELWNKDSIYSGNKIDGIENVNKVQKSIQSAKNIVIVGSGALGIEFAADIADHYQGTKAKNVTLLSSSTKLLPRLKPEIHQRVYPWLTERGVNVLLGERLAEQKQNENGEFLVTTNKGTSINADLVLDCTGLKANTAPLKSILGEEWIDQTPAWTNEQMQLLKTSTSINDPIQNIYIAGDAGHALGAHKNGANAREQAGIASRNICRQIALIQQSSQDLQSSSWAKKFLSRNGKDLEIYKPGPVKMKVSLGLTDAIVQGEFGIDYREGGKPQPDFGVEKHWVRRGLSTDDMFA